jgi:hypothetical protein
MEQEPIHSPALEQMVLVLLLGGGWVLLFLKGLSPALSCLMFECHPVGCPCLKEQTSPFNEFYIINLPENLRS